MRARFRSPTRLAHLLLGAALSVTPTLQADKITLPDIGASAGAMVTPAEEERMGRQFMRSVRASLAVMEDPLLVEYVENLGQGLASNADSVGTSFSFFLIDQPLINAFAGPGGHIGVYSGLILATESESELASVVAHEIAHVTQAHLVRAFENASQMSGPTAALLLAAILLGSAVSSEAGIAAAVGIQAAAVQQQLNFTREHEKEADRVGIGILAKSEYDPHAMPVFFERLAKSSRLYENNAPEFLRTHPVTTNRIADALGRADGYPYRQKAESPDYYLVRATLREKAFASPDDAVNHFSTTLREGRYRDERAEHYGHALALLRAKRYQEARKAARRLLEQAPNNTAFVMLDARIRSEMGDAAGALDSLKAALDLFPGNYPLTHAFAELSLREGQGQRALPMLEEALMRRPDSPGLHELRARAAADLGQSGDAYLHRAESLYLNGQLEPAVQLLRTAVKDDSLDFYASSKLQAKLEIVENELKAQEEAEKK